MWLMSRVTVHSSWTVLLPGFLIAGVGIGFVNAPLATTAVSTVRRERAGMASGINNTFRQLGIATGIAALGAIFTSRISTHLHGGQHRLAVAVSSGQVGHSPAARSAFVLGFSDILIAGAAVAAIGAVLALALVRPQDFVASAPAEAASR
jgi:hypothetical protein